MAADRRIEGMPLFDAEFTDAGGIRGRLGALQSDAAMRYRTCQQTSWRLLMTVR